MTEEFVFTKDFDKINNDVRSNWEIGRAAAKHVGKKLNQLVALVHKEEPEWSINKIAQQIWVANEDLEGFSKQTIYNNLNDENKQLLQITQKQPKKRNNVLEERFTTLETNVIEDSSSASARIPNTDPELEQILKDLPEPVDNDKPAIYNAQELADSGKQIIKLQTQLQKQQQQIREFQVDKFDFEYDYEMPSGDIIPFIVTVFPAKRDGYIRLNKAKIEENERKEAKNK